MKKIHIMITLIIISLSTTTVVFGAEVTKPVSTATAGQESIVKKEPIGKDVKQVGDIAPYTFSQTRLDYPYNVYMEGKGFMDFGKDKPFVYNGGIYLPLKHFAYFNNWKVTWNPTDNTITLDREYTEKNSPTNEVSELRGEFLDKVVAEANGVKYLPMGLGNVQYLSRESIVMKLNSNVVLYNTYSTLSEWGEKFLMEGGTNQTDIGHGLVYIGYDVYSRLCDGVTPVQETLTTDYNIISRNGTAYIQRTDLGGALTTVMLMSEHNKTLYYGSQEYLQKVMEEVVNPNLKMDETFNNGKSYEDVMNDVFKNAEDYSKR